MKHEFGIKNQSGFIALISVIVIAAILIILVALVSTTNFFTRFNVLDYENKKVSTSLAEGCINTAIVNLAKDVSYAPVAGGDCLSMGGTCGGVDPQKVCRICSVTTSGSNKIIVARAKYNKAYTNITAKVTPGTTDFTVNSWDETATYTGSPCIVP
jgi:hypothetical protein